VTYNILNNIAAIILLCTTSAHAGEELYVTNTTLYPGQVINAANVISIDKSKCVSCKDGYISDIDLIIGKITTKTVLANRPIYQDAVREPALLRRGQNVLVTLRSGSLQISMQGQLLTDGRAGENITIRNHETGSIVTGLILPDGTIFVNPS
jgi:flagellar basal body P-ring formation protein FlgA